MATATGRGLRERLTSGCLGGWGGEGLSSASLLGTDSRVDVEAEEDDEGLLALALLTFLTGASVEGLVGS